MALQKHAYHLDEPNRKYSHDNGNAYHHRTEDITFSYNSYENPNVFLDLRNYFTSTEPSLANQPTRDRNHHHKNRSYSRSSDYISPPSASRSRHTQSDYIFHAPRHGQHNSSYSSHTHDTNDTARSEKTEYTSPWDKSDYQMIKEGGWTSQKDFMESHGLSIYEPGDFDEAKELLDGYRRADAEAARESVDRSEYDYDSRYTDRYSRRHESNGGYDEDDTDLINEYEDDERITRGGEEFSSESRGTGRASGYPESSVSGYGDEQDHLDESDEEYPSSDDDSTDAIGYYSDSDVDDSDDLEGDDLVDSEDADEYDDDYD